MKGFKIPLIIKVLLVWLIAIPLTYLVVEPTNKAIMDSPRAAHMSTLDILALMAIPPAVIFCTALVVTIAMLTHRKHPKQVGPPRHKYGPHRHVPDWVDRY